MSSGVLAVVLALGLLGARAAIAGEACRVPMSEWRPPAALKQKLEAGKWQVSRIRTDAGCYAVHGVDRQGRRIEAHFDPKTFAIVKQKIED